MRTAHSGVRVEGDDVRCKIVLQSRRNPSASNAILKQQYFLYDGENEVIFDGK